MQLQSRSSKDGATLPELKLIADSFKNGCKDVSTSVDNFSDYFWARADKSLHPVEVSFFVGLIVGMLGAVVVKSIFGRK